MMSHRIGRRVCLVLLAAAIVAAGVVSAREAPAPRRYDAIGDFRERLRADVAADAVGGITAAVVVGDDIVWAEGLMRPSRKNPARRTQGKVTYTYSNFEEVRRRLDG